MNSHDPDRLHAMPATPDAEAMTPPEVSPDANHPSAVGEVTPDSISPSTDAVEPDCQPPDPLGSEVTDADPPLCEPSGWEPSDADVSEGALAFPKSFGTESFGSGPSKDASFAPEFSEAEVVIPESSGPGPFGAEAPEAEPSGVASLTEPGDSEGAVAEVWTELDEAEPRVLGQGWARTTEPPPPPRPWGEDEERSEPDSSGLDTGSGPRREAETPGRTGVPYDVWEPSEVPSRPREMGGLDQLLAALAAGAMGWRRLLRRVRSRLPIPWQRLLSDDVMTAIVLGLVILGLVLWNPLGGRSGSSGVVVQEPGGSDVAQPLEGQIPSTVTDGTGASLEAAANSPEALDPTPEQSLIADIQARVSQISRSYVVGLVQSVEVNWPQQVIAINVSNNWYGLGDEAQDTIAQSIYTQTQGLAFSTLQLRDPEGVVVARNPVVGPAMVILKRHRPGDGDPRAA